MLDWVLRYGWLGVWLINVFFVLGSSWLYWLVMGSGPRSCWKVGPDYGGGDIRVMSHDSAE